MNQKSTTLQRLRNRYRLVVMNDDTYEEVVTFKLTRLSVYIAFCSTFVVLVGLTVALIVFTPLKYYIPGFGNRNDRQKLMALKIRADSIEASIQDKDAYIESLRVVLTGGTPQKRDTMLLDFPDPEKIED
ncbi:MAG: hypothetical protein ACK5VH_04155 [bacterium]|jgi:hypothetical protein|nr:hypothetical protein [Chitinophagaceae bacterium]